MSLAVISNPLARQNRRRPAHVQNLRAMLEPHGAWYQPMSQAELDVLIQRLVAERLGCLVIHGGDGTIKRVVTSLIQASTDVRQAIAILPGGTNNAIARGFGIKGSSQDVLSQLLNAFGTLEFKTTRRWPLEVDHGGNDPTYGFLFSNGLFAKFLELYDEAPAPDMRRAGWLLARTAASALINGPLYQELAAPLKLRITVDGVAWSGPSYLATPVATVEDLGFGFRVFPRAQEKPGCFQALGFTLSGRALAMKMPAFLLGRGSGRGVLSSVGQEMIIEAEAPMCCFLDGDVLAPSQRIVLRAGPPLEVYVPSFT